MVCVTGVVGVTGAAGVTGAVGAIPAIGAEGELAGVTAAAGFAVDVAAGLAILPVGYKIVLGLLKNQPL